MIQKFKAKLKKNNKSLSWFHSEHIRHLKGKKINWTNFEQQIKSGCLSELVGGVVADFLKNGCFIVLAMVCYLCEVVATFACISAGLTLL